MTMNPETLNAIHGHALSCYPNEACGLVAVIQGVEQYIPCANLAATPSEHFRLSARDYASVEDRGEITHIVHSHPDEHARPSEGDRVACEHSGLPWYIVSVMCGDDGPYIAGDAAHEPSGYKPPLLGRRFVHGVLDCWALCRDWYAQEWGIELPDPDRHDNWWDDGKSNLYMDNLDAAGFDIVQDDTMERGDLLLMQIRSKNQVPNHAGIYLGDGQFIHHLYGRLSARDVWGGYWREKLRYVARLRNRATIAKTDNVQ